MITDTSLAPRGGPVRVKWSKMGLAGVHTHTQTYTQTVRDAPQQSSVHFQMSHRGRETKCCLSHRHIKTLSHTGLHTDGHIFSRHRFSFIGIWLKRIGVIRGKNLAAGLVTAFLIRQFRYCCFVSFLFSTTQLEPRHRQFA